MKIVLLVWLAIFLIVIGPIITIWSINTLFPVVAIPYTIQTWAATIIIGGVFKASTTK
jgi:hypothetical protein